MAIQYLSHVLHPKTPGYAGEGGLEVFQKRSLECGHSANSQIWTLSNHIGTHVDAPLHFVAKEPSVDSFYSDFWFCKKTVLVRRPAAPGEMISLEGLTALIPPETECLLIKTEFERFRDDSIYWENNPGIEPSVAEWLRAYTQVRFLGLDTISLSAYSNRPLGRRAHQAFLDSKQGTQRPILIVEDMHLSELHSSPRWVLISPLRVQNADGAPVTVWADVADVSDVN